MHALPRRSPRPPALPPAGALPLLVSVWAALAWGGALAPAIGRGAALLVSFGLATALCATDAAAGASTAIRPARRRPAGRRARQGPRGRGAPPPPARARTRAGRSAWRLLAGLAAGVAVMPGLCAITAAAGRALGLAPPIVDDAIPSPGELVATGLLAPVFEEHLYRGRLLPALVPRVGRMGALLVTSALFALPHLEPWAVLGAGVAGLVLGGRRLATGRVSDCIALHAGMNGAGLASAVPTTGPSSALPPALWLAATTVGMALLVPRRPRAPIARREAGAAGRRSTPRPARRRSPRGRRPAT